MTCDITLSPWTIYTIIYVYVSYFRENKTKDQQSKSGPNAVGNKDPNGTIPSSSENKANK